MKTLLLVVFNSMSAQYWGGYPVRAGIQAQQGFQAQQGYQPQQGYQQQQGGHHHQQGGHQQQGGQQAQGQQAQQQQQSNQQAPQVSQQQPQQNENIQSQQGPPVRTRGKGKWRHSPKIEAQGTQAVKPRSYHGKNDYRWEIAGCHALPIKAEPSFRQFLVSDSFPNINPSEQDCVWKLNAPSNHIVHLTWREFHIDGCARSAVYIFDGKESEVAEPALRLCGKRMPADFRSTGSTVHVRLQHAETYSPKGYKLMLGFEAKKVKAPAVPPPPYYTAALFNTSYGIASDGNPIVPAVSSDPSGVTVTHPPRLTADIYSFSRSGDTKKSAESVDAADKFLMIVLPSLLAVVAIGVIIKTYLGRRLKAKKQDLEGTPTKDIKQPQT